MSENFRALVQKQAKRLHVPWKGSVALLMKMAIARGSEAVVQSPRRVSVAMTSGLVWPGETAVMEVTILEPGALVGWTVSELLFGVTLSQGEGPEIEQPAAGMHAPQGWERSPMQERPLQLAAGKALVRARNRSGRPAVFRALLHVETARPAS